MNGWLVGRVAWITGGGRGLGRQCALTLADRGCRVAVTARSTDELDHVVAEIGAQGGEAVAVAADLTDSCSVATAADTVSRTLGRVDILVANAGVPGPTSLPLWEISDEEWNATFEVNVSGVFRCCRAVLPGMIAEGQGSVVMVGSMTGKRPLPNRTPYGASKSALIGLCRSLALEAGPHGVRVNMVSPGPVTGPRLDLIVQQRAKSEGLSEAEVRAAWEKDSPLRRLTEAAEVATAVAFLVDDSVAGGITGQDLNVSSGIVSY
jgi:NAD(P)-dependent dehydrogenase (short-subunit alcohol dehydrogenase family)